MSVYLTDLKRDIKDNEARRKVADDELNKLNLKDMFEKGELTKALYEAAKWAGNNDSTYRELVVALMHALPEEWKEKVEDTLEGQQFMVSTEEIHRGGTTFIPSRGEPMRLRFLHEDPSNRKGSPAKRSGARWTRKNDLASRIWSTGLRHRRELRRMNVDAPADQTSLNESFGNQSGGPLALGSSPASSPQRSGRAVPSINGPQQSMFPAQEKFPNPTKEGDKLELGEDEQRYRAILWALAKAGGELTNSEDQMSKLQGDLDSLSEFDTQQARIAETKRVLRHCYLASLLDAMAMLDDFKDVMTVTSDTHHLDKQAYRQLKATMEPDQFARFNSYNLGAGIAGGKLIKTLKGLLDFMVRDQKLFTTPLGKSTRQSSGSLCHTTEISGNGPNGLVHDSRKRDRATKTALSQDQGTNGRTSSKRTKEELDREDTTMQQGVASMNTQATMDSSIARQEVEAANKRAREAEENLKHSERMAEMEKKNDQIQSLTRELQNKTRGPAGTNWDIEDMKKLMVNFVETANNANKHTERKQDNNDDRGANPYRSGTACRDFTAGRCNRDRCSFRHDKTDRNRRTDRDTDRRDTRNNRNNDTNSGNPYRNRGQRNDNSNRRGGSPKQSNSPCFHYMDGDCPFGDRCSFSHDTPENERRKGTGKKLLAERLKANSDQDRTQQSESRNSSRSSRPDRR